MAARHRRPRGRAARRSRHRARTHTDVAALPATSPTPSTARPDRRRGRRPRPARQQRVGARAEPAAARSRDYPLDTLEHVYRVNVLAPLALIQLARPHRPRILNLTSDAAVEAYEGWGGYGSAKAALDHLSAVLAVERHDLRIYAVDPGDMNTRMHQEAFPGEDISDRPPPEASVPGLLALIEGDLPERALPGAGAGPGVTALDFAPPRAPRSRGAAAGARRRAAARGPPGRTARPHATSSTSPPTCARRPAGRQRLGDAPRGAAARPAQDGTRHRPAPLDARPANPGHWVVELRRDGRRVRDGAAAETLALPAGGRATLLAPYLSPGRLWVARARPPHRAARLPRRPRRTDPLRPRTRAAAARATTRRSSPPTPAAPRCRAPAARSPSAR